MNRILFSIVILLWIVGCQQSPENPIVPAEKKSSDNTLAKGEPLAGFVIEPGFTAEVIADGLTGPEGVAIQGNGVMYIVNSGAAKITKVTPSGNISQFAQIPFTDPPIPALTDLVIEPSRGIFTSLLHHGKIFNVSSSGNVTEYASGLNMPTSIAFDSDRELYVCEIWDNRVTKVDRFGTPMTVIQLDEQRRPRGLVFDAQDRLYVVSSSFAETKIRCFDIRNCSSFPMTDGVIVATIPEPYQAQDITFGFDGDLFVVGRNNVYRAKLNGTVTTFATGLQGNFNKLAVNSKGELIISDYAQNLEGAGRVIRVSRNRQ
jgi:sugar lactone lactonase YvrE